MKNEAILTTERGTARLVTASKLLELIWPDEDCRPCIRSVRSWTASRIIPHVRIGHLVFYDPEAVWTTLEKRTVKLRK